MYTEQSAGLFRSCFVLFFFVSVSSWLCNEGNKEASQVCVCVCVNRPSGESASVDNEQEVGSSTNTLDLVQLTVLPLSPSV